MREGKWQENATWVKVKVIISRLHGEIVNSCHNIRTFEAYVHWFKMTLAMSRFHGTINEQIYVV